METRTVHWQGGKGPGVSLVTILMPVIVRHSGLILCIILVAPTDTLTDGAAYRKNNLLTSTRKQSSYPRYDFMTKVGDKFLCVRGA